MKLKINQLWINVILIFVILAALGLLAWTYFSQYNALNRTNLDAFISGFGPWAAVAYGVIYVIASPVPYVAQILSAASGLLFGIVRGTIYTMLSATLSSYVPYGLARRLGRDWLEEKLRGHKLEKIYQQSADRGGFLFVLLMRLIPILPWEVQNYVAGLSKVPPHIFGLATIIGIIPGSISLVLLGATSRDPGSWEFYLAIGLNIVVLFIPAAFTAIRQFVRSRKDKETESKEEPAE
jgi:uncharacterized membrane protein YdjX (TVP38/TMEM64 family)